MSSISHETATAPPDATLGLGEGFTAQTKLEYRRQEVGNLCPNHREERLVVTYRIGNIGLPLWVESRPKRSEVFDTSCVTLQYESGGFAQRKSPMELLWGKFQDIVPMRPSHS